MKPENLAEAIKLVEDIRLTKEQHHQLSLSDEMNIQFFNRQVKITKDDTKFENIKRSMLTLLDLRLAEQYRRAAQIDLCIKSVVLKAPEPVKEPSIRDIMPSSWADEANSLFGIKN